jgi:hypothetical protein
VQTETRCQFTESGQVLKKKKKKVESAAGDYQREYQHQQLMQGRLCLDRYLAIAKAQEFLREYIDTVTRNTKG